MTIGQFARRTHLERTRAESLVFVVGSTCIALGTLFGVAWYAGLRPRVDAASMRSSRSGSSSRSAPRRSRMSATSSATARSRGSRKATRCRCATRSRRSLPGFGAFVAQGGFAVDLHAFRDTGISDREARVRVLGLGALEYAAARSRRVHRGDRAARRWASRKPAPALTLPWAIAVPIGFAAAIWAVGHRARFHGTTGWRERLGQALDSIYVLRCLFSPRAAPRRRRSAPRSTGSATSSASGRACRRSRTARRTSGSSSSAMRPATR